MQRLIRGLCCSYLCRRPGLRWLDRNIYIENNAIMLATRHGITSIRSVINWYFISHLWCSLSGVFLFLTIMIIVRNVRPVSSYRSHSHPLLFELGYLKEKINKTAVSYEMECWNRFHVANPLKHLLFKTRHLFHPKSIDIFLISAPKHMLWVLIRSGAPLLMSALNICFNAEIGKLFTWHPSLIWSYGIPWSFSFTSISLRKHLRMAEAESFDG